MKAEEIRQSFLDFFESKKHQIVNSASLLPESPNLLFTNAGMNQFVPYFLGDQQAPYFRAADTRSASVQVGNITTWKMWASIPTITPFLKCWVIGLSVIILKGSYRVGLGIIDRCLEIPPRSASMPRLQTWTRRSCRIRSGSE